MGDCPFEPCDEKSTDLRRHIEKKHSQSLPGVCRLCRKEIGYSQLKKHWEEEHKENKNCDKCKKSVESTFDVVMGHSCLEDSNEVTVRSLKAEAARLNDEAQSYEKEAERLRKKALERKEEAEKLEAET